MNSKLNLSHPGHPRHDTTPRTAPAIFAALVVALVCVLAAAYGYGRTAQEVATRADAVSIVSENHAFCTELGLLPPIRRLQQMRARPGRGQTPYRRAG